MHPDRDHRRALDAVARRSERPRDGESLLRGVLDALEPEGAADELRVAFTDPFGTWRLMVLFSRRRFARAVRGGFAEAT